MCGRDLEDADVKDSEQVPRPRRHRRPTRQQPKPAQPASISAPPRIAQQGKGAAFGQGDQAGRRAWARSSHQEGLTHGHWVLCRWTASAHFLHRAVRSIDFEEQLAHG
jgi:hypothetical protein